MKAKRQFDFYRAALSLKKQWPLCLTIFISVMLLGVIASIQTQKLYKASAIIKVNLEGQNSKLWPEATNYQIMTSSIVSVNPSRDLKSASFDVINQNPKIAADLANQAVSDYLKYQTLKRDEAVQKEEKLLESQLKKEEKLLEFQLQKEEKFSEFQRKKEEDLSNIQREREDKISSIQKNKEESLSEIQRVREEKLSNLQNIKEDELFNKEARLSDLKREQEEKMLNFLQEKEEKWLEIQIKEAKENLAVSEKNLDDYSVKNKILNNSYLESQINR